MSNHLGFREVVPDQSKPTQWKNISVDTGAAQSTLQDIKVPDYGGCYTYKCNTSPITQNRYIFWRVCHDVLEIWEDSLNINTDGNHLQLRFADTPILEGLSVHETKYHVIILLATISSVHCIRLLHPTSANLRSNVHSSIFSEVTFHNFRDYHRLYLFNSNSTGESLPHTAATYFVTEKEKSFFLLGQSKGSFLLVEMSALPPYVATNIIKTASLMNRFFTGFVPSMFRGMEGGETVSSVVMAKFGDDLLAFGICFDSRIRVWSCSRYECLLAYNALENTAELGKKLTIGAQRHLMRSYTDENTVYLVVYLSFAEQQLILLLSPCRDGDQLTMNLLKTYYPPRFDLIDITITSSYIWSLFLDNNNETKLMYATIHSSINQAPDLQSAYLDPLPEKDVPFSESVLDSSEVLMKLLLTPFKLSVLTLQKALSIYRRNYSAQVLDTDNINRSDMAEKIEAVLREEVASHLSSDMTEEEISEIRLNAWSTFYSHALQYHQVGCKAISIVGVGAGGLAAILRKQWVSWIRPVDALELLLLGEAHPTSLAAIASTPVFNEDISVAFAVIGLSRPLRTLKSSLEPEVVSAFKQDLHHLQPPDQVSYSIASSLLLGEGIELDEPISRLITSQLSSLSVVCGLQAYLKALQLDLGNPNALKIDDPFHDKEKSDNTTVEAEPFGSNLGASILSAVVHQFAHQRFELCRDLLLLQQMLLKLDVLGPDCKHKIHSTLISQTTLLTQAYFALMSVTQSSVIPPLSNNAEISRRQIAALGLNDCNGQSSQYSSTNFPNTAVELFTLSAGGAHARNLVFNNMSEKKFESWGNVLMPMATTVSQLVWPISKCLLFPEFLVWEGQHNTLQEYVRLLQNWCEWNSCSRKFLLGVSLLNEGEATKAQGILLTACEGVGTEEYLGIRIAGGLETSLEEAKVQYCLKVIRLLEQSSHPALALNIAKAAVAIASPTDSGIAALYSVMFKFHLELEHHDEAFTSLMSCPDEHRRRNCLRQFIVTLYDMRCLSLLVKYNYGLLESEVINILENRARSADILASNYYDLLFSFHISKHNYKKAAWVMYECANRLNIEGLGEKGLKHQAKCFLACLNCLRHIPKEQAWVIKPISVYNDQQNDRQITEVTEDLKALMKSKNERQLEVYEICDIDREYEIVHARLKLFKFCSSTTNLPGGPMNASDTIALLTHSKLFKDAIRLCSLFNHPIDSVFDGIASACVYGDRNNNPASEMIWLSENGIHKDRNEGALWWVLLRELLTLEKSPKQSYLHNIVCSNILHKGHTLPAWLVDDYKKRNCGELLKLYLSHGFLEEATRLSMSYIDAVLGHGTEQMGLNAALHAGAPAVWLPYNALDHLVLELKEARSQPQLKELYTVFREKMKRYVSILNGVSKDTLM